MRYIVPTVLDCAAKCWCRGSRSSHLVHVLAMQLYNFSFYLASAGGYFVGRVKGCSLMRAGSPSSIPGADNLDSWFHPYGVGRMSRSQYVDEWPLQKTVDLKHAAVKMATYMWLMLAATHTTAPCSPTVGAGALEVTPAGHLRCLRNVRLQLWLP